MGCPWFWFCCFRKHAINKLLKCFFFIPSHHEYGGFSCKVTIYYCCTKILCPTWNTYPRITASAIFWINATNKLRSILSLIIPTIKCKPSTTTWRCFCFYGKNPLKRKIHRSCHATIATNITIYRTDISRFSTFSSLKITQIINFFSFFYSHIYVIGITHFIYLTL